MSRLGDWIAGFSDRHEIRLSPNRISLRNSRTGESLDGAPARPFSSEHMLLADPAAAQVLLGELVRALEGRKRLLKWPNATFYLEDEPSAAEAQSIRRMAREMGYSKVEIIAR